MSKLKAALLDDNKEQLQLNQQMLENYSLVSVVSSCTSSKTFLEEVKLSRPEILFLDLNLGDSYMTGMEVAFQLKMPVLFVSSNTGEYIKEIEKLKRDYDLCIDHITKPFTEQEFIKTTQRFLKEVELFKKEEFIHLDFGASKRNKIAINSIVYLSTDKNNGAESNNKQIHFTNRKPENLIDFSFSKMEDKGLLKSNFITIHKSFRVNSTHIKAYHKSKESVEVDVFTAQGKLETKLLQVSENYQPLVKQLKK
ncbi:Two-component system response regulatory protein, LytTR family [Flavobacterium psychrophilum]|uniref:LytR/AlgR family response regulator transcription factor n=1 Tax=Flavobacterium psychrophilum TaxID=96345 RepID=UPI000B7C41B3|nr:response regulator transcription factor [Flavobacterium psychrophilum]SNB28249.1 Two-component system response regulatory protein, LytTR family [Flavobacterium psychrophilum]